QMFPSARHFAGTDCPVLSRGRCERPYCLYKHSARGVPVTGAAGHDHIPETSPFQNQEVSNPCLLELERINKQIEAVRSEVEKERERLSRYQSEQGEGHGPGSQKDFKSRLTLSKDHNRNQMLYKKTTTSKYVVDRTRPKTDLEYDPCSNFSADLRSGSSVDKIRAAYKADTEHDQRDSEASESVCADSFQASSCILEDSDEGALVIDIPPFENGRRPTRSQKQRTTASDAMAVLGGGECEEGEKRASKKGANITRISGERSERDGADTGFLLLEKNVAIRPTKTDMNTSQLRASPQISKLINVPHQDSDSAKPKPSSVPPGDGRSLGIGPVENEKKQTASEEAESSRKLLHVDDSPVRNAPDKGTKQSPTALKGDEEKKLISKQLVTIRENILEPHENARSLIVDIGRSSEVSHLDKPVSEDMVNLDGFEERGQNIETVLDDLSMCLDHLRSESEGVACLQDVADLLDMPDCSKNNGDLFSPPAKTREQSVITSRTELCAQQNKLHSGFAHKAEILAPACSQETVVFQDCFPNMSPLSAMTKGLGPGPSSTAFAETRWSPHQNVLPRSSDQNVSVYVLGTDVISVPSTQSMELLGSVTSPVAVTSCGSYATGSVSPTPSPAVTEASNNEVVRIDSSSSEELHYSDFDLSETDPMEECYNIFMEANKDVPEVSKMSETDASLQSQPVQKKRVAHVAKFEVSKSKVQVPLREGGSQLPVPSRTQQCQKRAATLTSALKGCQSFIATSVPRRVLSPAVTHPNPAPNSCVSFLPVGATLRLGSDLHLIVPEGNCALPITLIPATVPVMRPLQPAQRPLPVQPANYTPAKAIPAKRKAKGRPEVGVKVPHDVRQRYVNLFVEEFLKTSATVQDAFEKALAEEKTVFDRSVNKLKYLSVAVNALKRLKNQNASPTTFSSEGSAQASRGHVALNTEALLGDGDARLYAQLKEHILTEALLRENNYPRQHPGEAGTAMQYGEAKKSTGDAFRRICCRCGTTFSVSQTGKHTRKEECNYHSGKVIENRVPGGVETRYSCCENAVGTPGCQVFKLHVHDTMGLQGFVGSLPQTRAGCPGVYAIATEMCYTTQGLELVRVTVVSSSLQVIYDSFVKPNSEVIDYNTRFSGVSEEEVKNSYSSLRDVQAVLLSFIGEDTILVGHGLENDLCALKLLHNTVLDTSVVFPHRLGRPHKRELHSLSAEILRRITRESGTFRIERDGFRVDLSEG
ncbi:hypothetical protein P4O66_013138, partial [Electrophorus voltai]